MDSLYPRKWKKKSFVTVGEFMTQKYCPGNDYCSHQTRILKIDGCLCQKSQELQHLATEDENHMENGQDYGEVDFRVGKKIKIRAPPKDDCY